MSEVKDILLIISFVMYDRILSRNVRYQELETYYALLEL